MSKKVTFNKPNRDNQIVNAEDWIKNREIKTGALESNSATSIQTEEKKTNQEIKHNAKENNATENATVEMKRITLDIPKSWHKQIKIYCAERELKMSEEILPLLKKHFSLTD